MDIETETLVRLWVSLFHEPPVLIDPELMRAVLADLEPKAQELSS